MPHTGQPAWNRMTPERFWSLTVWRGECQEWVKEHPSGYGRVAYHGKDYKANRLAWILTNGPIPDGLHVLHTCDNPRCVRPSHLFLGTHAQNMADMVAKGRSPSRPGTSNHWAKFTDAQVQAIRASHRSGASIVSLAGQYGADRHTISRLIRGLSYR